MSEEIERLFRYCVHCGADCWTDEPAHADTCPSVTGVWPVREEDEMPCPHCGKGTRQADCADCGESLKVGDFYVLRDEAGELVIKREEGSIGEVICVGCAARLGLAI